MSGEQAILRARGPYSLAASACLLEGFAPGVGDFYAQLIGSQDFLPTAESRLLRAVARAYAIEAPTRKRIEAIAESWRPFRSWIAFLLRVSLEDATHEIAEGR